jgi:hypothetical protein
MIECERGFFRYYVEREIKTPTRWIVAVFEMVMR